MVAALSATRAVRVTGPLGNVRATERIRGSVRRVGDIVRVTVRIEPAGNGAVNWTGGGEQTLGQVRTLREKLISEILAALGLPARTAHVEPRPVDPAAYDLWLRARYLLPRRRQVDVAGATTLLARALARDSAFAPAWADLARTLLLDSTNVDTWLLRADVANEVDPTSRSAALAALRHALAIDSTAASTWDEYAVNLEESGDPGAAAESWRRAAALDPDRPLAMYAYHFFWTSRYDSAAAWAEHAVAGDPTRMFYRELGAEIALARGRLDEARAGYEAALRLGAGPEQVRALAGLAVVRAAGGDTIGARNLIVRAEAVSDSAAPTVHSALSIAEAYVAIGASERALAWFQRYQPRRDLHFQLHLARDPTLEPLRALPAFRTLVSGP